MRRLSNPGLYWRILASYLLVILVVCVTLYWVAEGFTSFFLEEQVGDMINQMRHMSPMMEAMSADIDAAYRRASEITMMWGLAAAALVAGAVGFFVTQKIVAPLRKMQRASRRIAAGHYHERLDMQAPGEIGELATSFNEMATSLEQTEQRRVELLANVAHEFKTPLSSLKGYISGVRDGVFSADDETFDSCERQIRRLERLVADLSLLSLVETGQVSVDPQHLIISDILEQSVAAFRPAFAEKGISITLERPSSSISVVADPHRTEQVLANLLDNALRYTPAGGEVRLLATPSREAVRVEVHDTGEGVSSEDQAHLFTRFYRADKARTHSSNGGSGIGLTIAKHYVERQGGEIGVKSAGSGSVFWFTLPYASGTFG